MIVNLVIAQEGDGFHPVKCKPITMVLEVPDNAKDAYISNAIEAAAFDLSEKHGIYPFLWGSSTVNTMEGLVDGFVKYFDRYERNRCDEMRRMGKVEIIGNLFATRCHKSKHPVMVAVGVMNFSSGEHEVPCHYCSVCNRKFIGRFTVECYEMEYGRLL